MQPTSAQIKQILTTVAEAEMIMVGPTIVEEIIEKEIRKTDISFTRSVGGYNLDTSEIIINGLSLMVSMIGTLISYWSYQQDKLKDKNDEEIDQVIISQHPEYLEIELKDRKLIIKQVTANSETKE